MTAISSSIVRPFVRSHARRSNASTAVAAPQPTIRHLINWRTSADGVWSGVIGIDHAGLIARLPQGFVVTDWKGDEQGVFASLDQAQLALEPDYRAQLREMTATIERAPFAMQAAFVAGTGATTLAVVAWLMMLVQF